MSLKNFIAVFVVTLSLASCGGGNSTSESNSQLQEVVEETVTPRGDTVEVVIKSEDNMKFDQSQIKVQLGQVVKLTLKHVGQLPKQSMGHNFVLINNKMKLDDFGSAAAKSTAPDYEIPLRLEKYVIAKTKMIGGGESDTIEFLTPPKGSYHFLCSFPGHYGMMKGIFIVE